MPSGKNIKPLFFCDAESGLEAVQFSWIGLKFGSFSVNQELETRLLNSKGKPLPPKTPDRNPI